MARPLDAHGTARGVARVSGTESSRRLMTVLLSFTETQPTWSVADLSRELELTQSAVYRYIGLLREVGLVDQAPGNRYRLSERTAALAAAANAARAPLGEIALPVVNRLRDTIDETVLVARRIGWHAFTVARAESRKPVRLQFEPGQAMTLHIGSMPRILLASMPEKEQERYLSTLDEHDRSSEFLSAQARQQVRRERVTESFEEIDEGIWGVAAAIVEGEEIVGALGCAAPIYRTDGDQRRRIRELVVASAAEVSAAMS